MLPLLQRNAVPEQAGLNRDGKVSRASWWWFNSNQFKFIEGIDVPHREVGSCEVTPNVLGQHSPVHRAADRLCWDHWTVKLHAQPRPFAALKGTEGVDASHGRDDRGRCATGELKDVPTVASHPAVKLLLHFAAHLEYRQ